MVKEVKFNYEKLEYRIEDLTDMMEVISEIFEQCGENKTVVRLLINALLYYCYFPQVLPPLVGCPKTNAGISIQTSLYALTLSLKHIKS